MKCALSIKSNRRVRGDGRLFTGPYAPVQDVTEQIVVNLMHFKSPCERHGITVKCGRGFKKCAHT